MKNKHKAFLGMIVPIILLIVVLTAFAITQFVLTTISLESGADVQTAASVIRAGLGLLGIVAIVAIVLIPLGILYAIAVGNKPEIISDELHARYHGLTDDEIRYIEGASFTAFFFTPIWAFANRLYGWGIVSLLPIINMIIPFYLAFKGRGIAWTTSNWGSVMEFRHRQKTAAYIAGLVVLIVLVLQMLLIFIP